MKHLTDFNQWKGDVSKPLNGTSLNMFKWIIKVTMLGCFPLAHQSFLRERFPDTWSDFWISLQGKGFSLSLFSELVWPNIPWHTIQTYFNPKHYRIYFKGLLSNSLVCEGPLSWWHGVNTTLLPKAAADHFIQESSCFSWALFGASRMVPRTQKQPKWDLGSLHAIINLLCAGLGCLFDTVDIILPLRLSLKGRKKKET